MKRPTSESSENTLTSETVHSVYDMSDHLDDATVHAMTSRRKLVHFAEVNVYFHETTMGSDYPFAAGPPIEIGQPFQECTIDIEEYEQNGRKKCRPRPLSVSQRFAIVRSTGLYTNKEILEVTEKQEKNRKRMNKHIVWQLRRQRFLGCFRFGKSP